MFCNPPLRKGKERTAISIVYRKHVVRGAVPNSYTPHISIHAHYFIVAIFIGRSSKPAS